MVIFVYVANEILFDIMYNLSCIMRKPAFCICIYAKTKVQLISAFVCTVLLLHKTETSSLKPSSVAVQPSLCQTWLEIPKTDFLVMQLILFLSVSSIRVNLIVSHFS